MSWLTLRLQFINRVYIMKKTLIYTIKLILPALLILSLMYLLRGGKNILEGIYILFPVIFVLQGVFCSDSLIQTTIGYSLTSAVFIVFVNLLYSMGSCVDLLIIYLVLGIMACMVKMFVIKKIREAKANK